MSKRIVMPLILTIILASSYWIYINYFPSDSDSIKATGTIEATTIDLSTRSAGTITLLSLDEGDTVKKDQLVAELSRSDLAAQRERDAMAVLSAESKLNDLASGARLQEIKAAIAAVNIAQTDFDQAVKDLDRAQQLFSEGAITREKIDQLQASNDQKKNKLEASQAQLSLLESGNRPQVLAGAAAELARAKAVLKATETMVEDLKIYCPINATVLSKNFEVGEYVATGTTLLTVADLERLWIKVYIPTDDLPAIKISDKVHFTVSGDKTVYTGTISHIASQGEFTPKTIQTPKERTNIVFAVKITIDKASGALKPGMPADVVFNRG